MRTAAFLRSAYSVHLFCVGEPPVPTAENLLFICGKADAYTSERFDRLGCRALERSSGCDLIVMDELGPHEADAVLFHTAVLDLLDGTVPILGVLQAPAERFWPDIVKHPGVRLLEVTKENREDLLWSGIFRQSDLKMSKV